MHTDKNSRNHYTIALCQGKFIIRSELMKNSDGSYDGENIQLHKKEDPRKLLDDFFSIFIV